jgi:hypothetical protein
MVSSINDASSSAAVGTDIPSSTIPLPHLSGTVNHLRQKSSRIVMGERQYPYDVVSNGTAGRVVPRSDPSPPLLHSRQYSEGALGEKVPPNIALSGRNASISSLDTSNFGTLTGMESSVAHAVGTKRRHGHSHSHAHSHHIPTAVSSKPASMMSIITLIHANVRYI